MSDHPEASPEASPAPGPVALVAVVAGAVIGTAVVPLSKPGLGWLLYGVTVVLGLSAVSWAQSRAEGKRSERVRVSTESLCWVIIALSLMSVSVIRAAGWLTVLCLLGAVLAGTLAITRARTTVAVVLAVLIAPIAACKGITWMARVRLAPRGNRANQLRTAVAAGVGLVLVMVFGALFAAADPAFARLIDAGVPDVTVSTGVRWCLLLPLFASLVLAGAFLLADSSDVVGAVVPRPPILRRVEWALPVGLLVSLFVVFVAVQLTELFGGTEYVMRTDNLTFATYARGGFWQLLLVTLLTLPVIAGAASVAPRTDRADRVWLRALLGALAACTLVIVASSLRRMWVYEQTFGFTRLRLVVDVCELWLGIVFVLMLAAGVRLSGAWLPRAIVGSGLIALLGLAILNPDQFIASQNVARYERTGKIDVSYLGELSADAAVALDDLPWPIRECALAPILFDLRQDDAWTEYNLGRSGARDIKLSFRTGWSTGC